jgi:uncharacterized membrane protein
MRRHTYGILLLVVVVIVGIVQIGYYYPKLPPTVASHFDAAGKANDWMPRESFVVFHAIVLASLLVVVILLRLLIPRVPVALINLPHKEYWLAPERRQETYASVFGFLLWCFNATGILLAASFELAYLANLGDPKLMSWIIWALLAVYVGFVVICLTVFYRRFANIPDVQPASENGMSG